MVRPVVLDVLVAVVGGLAEVRRGLVHEVRLEHGVLAELVADDKNDRLGRLADGQHGDGGEDERQGGAEEDAREHHGARDGHGREPGGLHEGGDEADRGQHGRADGKALARGGGRVAHGVEGVRVVADLLAALLDHLGDAAGVVGDGAVGVGGEGDAEGREHADGRDGDAVRVAERRGGDDGDREDDGGRHARDHADAEALDDDGGGAGHAAVLDRDDGAEVERGEVLGELTDDDAGEEADDDAVPDVDAHAEHGDGGEVGEDDEEAAGDVHALLEREHESAERHIPALALLLGGDEEEADNGGEDANSGEQEGERDGLLRLAGDDGVRKLGLRDGERGRGDERANVRLEEIGAHAGDVTDVVTDVVGDDGGVVRVVLVDAGLDLADQVGADVGGLGVDATGHAREERDGGGAEAEAGQALHGLGGREATRDLGGQHNVADGHAGEAEADDGEAHHGTGGEGHAKAVVQAALLAGLLVARRRGGGLGVTVGGNHHAPPASAGGEGRAEHEGQRDGARHGAGIGRIEETEEGERERDHEDAQVGVLRLEEGDGTRLDLQGELVENGHANVSASLELGKLRVKEGDEDKRAGASRQSGRTHAVLRRDIHDPDRSEEHTSELQSP